MAITYRNLWPQLISFENLWRAYLAARKGKRGRPTVAGYEFDAETRLLRLQERLIDGSYQPGAYRTFVIQEWKRRRVSAAPFEDRIVHHAICQILEPIWEKRFIHDTYACRKGRGTLAAVDRAQCFARHYLFTLQLDIREFFPSIDHAILGGILAHHIGDQQVLDLCHTIIASGRDILAEEYTPVYFPGDDLFAIDRPRGLPIGNLTSQFWANVYLHPLDLFIKQALHCKAYLRYCDDLLLFANDKATLHTWAAAIQEQLAGLRLTVHIQRIRIAPVDVGFPYLGWTVYPKIRRLRRRNVVRFWRRYRARLAAYGRGEIDLERLECSVHGWIGATQHGSTRGLRVKLLRTTIPKRVAKASQRRKEPHG